MLGRLTRLFAATESNRRCLVREECEDEVTNTTRKIVVTTNFIFTHGKSVGNAELLTCTGM